MTTVKTGKILVHEERAQSIMQGMLQSYANAILWRNEPEVYFQFYLGLYLEKPTVILIRKKDRTPYFDEEFSRNSLVHSVTEVDDFDEQSVETFGNAIQSVVKEPNQKL